MKYGMTKIVNLSFEAAIEKVKEQLQKVGFGILTVIDVQETMKKKLNIDFPKYIILGACNPPFAHKALTIDEQIGLLLPCNVIVYEKDKKTYISIFDPNVIKLLNDQKEIHHLAEEIRAKLEKVLETI